MPRNSSGVYLGLADCVATTDAMLHQLAKTSSPADLEVLMDAIANELGFRHYALIHHDDLRGNPPDRVKLLAYPGPIVDRIIDQATWRRDPIIRACNFVHQAFLWSDLSKIIALERRDEACLEAGAKLGLNAGVTVPFHLLGECAGSCTFAGTRRPQQIARLLGLAQMIGVFAFQAARRLVRGERVPAPPPRLQPRPRDCVTLAGRGLSNKQIARALALTPRTVDGYLTEARLLFGAHDRTELVVSAVLAGEIGLHELAARQPE